jgi:Zn-dependent metalloprotease
MTRTSQFGDARRAVVSSALTLFRDLPEEERTRKVAAVNAAFDAVGIV